MAIPCEFVRFPVEEEHRLHGERVLAEIVESERQRGIVQERGANAFAGLAVERALVDAVNRAPHGWSAELSALRSADLVLRPPSSTRGRARTVEVKTRVNDAGWTTPEKFDWLTLPGRASGQPIKDVDLIWFCWWSADAPDRAWLVGQLGGLKDFLRLAVHYGPGEHLPRGGGLGAESGGTYVLDILQLAAPPAALFGGA